MRYVGRESEGAVQFRCEALLRPFEGGPLHTAALRGDAAAARELLKAAGGDADTRDGLGSTPIFFAAAAGSAEAVALLLDAGADPSLPNHLGLTPLHACCCQPGPDSVEALRLLLSAPGADASAPTRPDADFSELAALAGDLPLTLAAQHTAPGCGAAPFIERLLAAGADPLQPSAHNGSCALELACAAGGGCRGQAGTGAGIFLIGIA